MKGKIVFKIFIDAAGRVTKVQMINGVDEEGWFEKCMVKKLIKSTFPRPKTHKGVIVTVAFIFG